MIRGETITLRTIREADLEILYDFHQDISNRGRYYPLGIMSEPVFKEKFQDSGFWEEKKGMMLIVKGKKILGHIEFFETVSYLDELELAIHIYEEQSRGRGIATEATQLMTGYLFDSKKINRIRLIIQPDNRASKRVAEKCGYRREGVARGAWYHRGENKDVEVYAQLRGEFNG